jgi:two-component system NtrC family response regulator
MNRHSSTNISDVNRKISILLVEDDSQQREIIASILISSGYDVTNVASAEEAMLAIKSSLTGSKIDVVFSDWKLGSFSGIDVLQFARKHIPSVGFAIATAYGTIAHAVDAIAAGADDYLAKPFQRQELLLCINKVNSARQLREQNTQLHAQLSQQYQLVDLVGNAPCMQKVYSRIERVSVTDATVLITGESGTGKELTARALHQLSPRSKKPFVPVNCGAIVETLAEAELFGAKKGAFTGAVKDSIGKLQSAHEGTLFLDEIGELSMNLQTRLLRFLQEGTITPVGDTQEIQLDVRVLAATHRNLVSMIESGEFREDLYYRLNIVPIEMPPLRARKEDIPVLIDFFLKKFQQSYKLKLPTLEKQTLKIMLDYAWPGNVRELSNRIERLVLLGDEKELRNELEVHSGYQQNANHTSSTEVWRLPEQAINWDEFEKDCLQQALQRFDNNKTLAAKHLGMSYKTFVYRLNKFSIT